MVQTRRFGRVIAGGRVCAAEFSHDDTRVTLFDRDDPLTVLAGQGSITSVCDPDEVVHIAPVAPSKVVCVGRNYRAHAKELGHEVPAEPLLFLKPPSAVVGHGADVVLPRESQRVEHEGELVVVIGRRARRVGRDRIGSVIAGYACGNDVTARDLQRKDVQFTRGKGFDTFCPVGPGIVAERPGDDARVRVRVDGVVRQDGRLGDMVFSIEALVSYITDVMTLEPGDLVFTGTPEGVGPLVDGCVVEVEIDGVGCLRNRVRAEVI